MDNDVDDKDEWLRSHHTRKVRDQMSERVRTKTRDLLAACKKSSDPDVHAKALEIATLKALIKDLGGKP